MLESDVSCIELLRYSGFLPDKIICIKCGKNMSLRFTSKFEGDHAYRCNDKCRKTVSIRPNLSINWPTSITIRAYVATIFALFPKGITGPDLSNELTAQYPPSHLSTKHALLFLHDIRTKISELMFEEQATTVLRDNVVVDETLWTHSVEMGRLTDFDKHASQVWVFGLIEREKP